MNKEMRRKASEVAIKTVEEIAESYTNKLNKVVKTYKHQTNLAVEQYIKYFSDGEESDISDIAFFEAYFKMVATFEKQMKIINDKMLEHITI